MTPPDDELEIERQPLDGLEGAAPDDSSRRLGMLRGALRGRPRRRELEALAVLGALVLAVAIVLGSIRGMADGTSAGLTVTPVPEQVALASNVTFGTFTLNGQRLKGSPPLLVTLRTGPNTITLTAAPFKPKTCTIVWPSDLVQGRDCSTGTVGSNVVIGGRAVTPFLTLYVTLSAADLPAALAKSAQAAVAAMLGSVTLHTTVPQGDYYALKEDAGGVPVAQRAATTMRADVAFLLNDDPTERCPPYGFCTVSVPFADNQGAPLPTNVWSVSVNAQMQWTFTPPGAPALIASPLDEGFPAQLWLSYDAAAGWHVSVPSGAFAVGQTLSDQLTYGICVAGNALMSNAAAASPQQVGGTGMSGTGDHGVDGCVIQLLPDGASGTAAPLGNVIWRFGALLAADAGAHKLLPLLPIAPPDEVHAVGD